MEKPAKKVRLFSLSTCPTCKKVKRFLEENGIAFDCIEVDMLDSGEQWLMSKELKKYNPAATYPTAVVEEVVLGYDEDALSRALGIR